MSDDGMKNGTDLHEGDAFCDGGSSPPKGGTDGTSIGGES